MGREFPYLTIEQAAGEAGESTSTIRRRIADGVLKSVDAGTAVFVDPDDLKDYLNRRNRKPGRRRFFVDDLKA